MKPTHLKHLGDRRKTNASNQQKGFIYYAINQPLWNTVFEELLKHVSHEQKQ
jgi:hypothetical protein